MKIAVMQPYHYPYAGYFRLFAASDLFVIYDDVQFNRRGRVHRYQKNDKWITLPIKKTDRDTTRIMDLEWRDGVINALSPLRFIVESLRQMCDLLKIPFRVIYASSLHLSEDLRSQDRILAICEKLKASEYINSPGGRKLYDEEIFAQNGIALTFLPDWKGSFNSIIERLSKESPEEIRKEIYENL